MKKVTAPGVTYVVYATDGATVTCPDRPDPLLTCAGGEPNYFTAPGAEVEISDDSATIAACKQIEKLQVVAGGGGDSGGLPSMAYMKTTIRVILSINGITTEDVWMGVKGAVGALVERVGVFLSDISHAEFVLSPRFINSDGELTLTGVEIIHPENQSWRMNELLDNLPELPACEAGEGRWHIMFEPVALSAMK